MCHGFGVPWPLLDTCLTFSGGLPESMRKALPRRNMESFMSSQREENFSATWHSSVPKSERHCRFLRRSCTLMLSLKKSSIAGEPRSPSLTALPTARNSKTPCFTRPK